MLIEVFKSLSRRVGVYHTIRYSKIYYRILKYKNPGYIRALDEDLAFYRRLLGDSLGLIFDVGANHGDKTWAFRRLAKRVISIEPDGTCFAALRTRYGRDRRVSLENVALGDRAGVGTFFVEDDGSAYNTLSEKERDWLVSEHGQNIRKVPVLVSTLDAMIAKYGVPDFLKIDVEGGELSVFSGLSHPVPIICFEANLPRFREESLRIIERFRSDKAARFNLRLENNFVFSSHQPAGEIISILGGSEEVSYDIFVFHGKTA